jgi:hypothetical protein
MIGNINTNLISYCDINLLFSSPKHGQVMLNECNDFAVKWELSSIQINQMR